MHVIVRREYYIDQPATELAEIVPLGSCLEICACNRTTVQYLERSLVFATL
jgi:hypothetical protein